MAAAEVILLLDHEKPNDQEDYEILARRAPGGYMGQVRRISLVGRHKMAQSGGRFGMVRPWGPSRRRSSRPDMGIFCISISRASDSYSSTSVYVRYDPARLILHAQKKRRLGTRNSKNQCACVWVSDMEEVLHEMEGYEDEVDGSSVKDDVEAFRHGV